MYSGKKRLAFYFLFHSIIHLSWANISIFGVFRRQSSLNDFEKTASNKALASSSLSLNWHSHYGLSSVISQMTKLQKMVEDTKTVTRVVFTDVNAMQGEMIKEILQMQEHVMSSNYGKTVLYDDGLGDALPVYDSNQMATDMMHFVESLSPSFKDLTIITDGTSVGKATLTHLIRKAYKSERYNIHITNAEKLITANNSISSNFLKSKQILIDCDGVLAIRLFKMAKSMGQARSLSSIKWVLSKRTMDSMPESCSIVGEYFGIVSRHVALNGSYIAKKTMQYSKTTSNGNAYLQSKFSNARHYKYAITEKDGLESQWADITEIDTDLTSLVVFKQGKDPTLPRLRVSVNEYEMYLIVSEYVTTVGDTFPCQIQGRLGIRRSVNGSDKLVCMHGFVIDILKVLETTLGFVGIPIESKDGKYGTFNERTGIADGIVGEIARNEADIAIDLYADTARSRAIDFTTPYFIEGFGFGYVQKSVFAEADVLKPFSAMLWISIAGTTVSLFIVLWMLERFSPYSQYQINKRSLDEKKTFNFIDSAVYIWGTFFTGEIIEHKPMAYGTRIIAIFVSCFSILSISVYSANLISFLVVLDESPLVNGLFDEKLLATSSQLHIGVYHSTYFDHYLTNHADERIKSLSLTRLKRYKAFDDLWQALGKTDVHLIMADYVSLMRMRAQVKDCGFKVMFLKGSEMGLAVSYNKKSIWNESLNNGVLDLVSSGKAEMIGKKWISSKDCIKENKFSSLDMLRMKMLFMWLAIGVGCCLAISAFAALVQRCKRLCKPRQGQEAL